MIGTHQANVEDKVRKGRQAEGERNGAAKLSAEAVQEIRRSSLGNRRLSRIYGVDKSVISRARRGLTWKHAEQQVQR